MDVFKSLLYNSIFCGAQKGPTKNTLQNKLDVYFVNNFIVSPYGGGYKQHFKNET
jgi:hypothetical protein